MNSYGWNKEICEPEFVRQETKKIEVSILRLYYFNSDKSFHTVFFCLLTVTRHLCYLEFARYTNR